jgi:hypothetical protein
VVYLLHFTTPLHHGRHYLGSTTDLDARRSNHRTGRGAWLMDIINQRSIDRPLARTWPGGRQEERRLKNQKRRPRLCPVCSSAGKGER